METKKIIALVLGIWLLTNLSAQTDTLFKKGILRGQANLSGGYLFSQKKVASYISGNLEYYFHEHFSVDGEAWCSFDLVPDNQTGLKKNFSLFSGVQYHPTRYSRWDPYIGIGSGVGMITTNYYVDKDVRESPVLFSPLVTINAGLNYYVGSIFHFFVQCRFVAGGNNFNDYGRTYLQELKFCGGLGWNINVLKKKKVPL